MCATINLAAELLSARIKFRRAENHPAIAEFYAVHFAIFHNSISLSLSNPHLPGAHALLLI
jgi:hypothetical protein